MVYEQDKTFITNIIYAYYAYYYKIVEYISLQHCTTLRLIDISVSVS